MKYKILIAVIILLALALFVETAYIFQLKFDKAKSSITEWILPHNYFDRYPKLRPYRFDLDLEFIDPFKEMERMKERIFPDIDLHETDTHYIVKLQMPDIDKNKVKIEVEDNSLVISGEKNKEEKSKGTFYKSFGSFRKVIPLPGNVKIDEVATEYKKDSLIVKLPKAFPYNRPKVNEII